MDNKHRAESPAPDEHLASTPSWVQRRLLPVLSIVMVIAIVAAVLYVYRTNPELIDRLKEYGYLAGYSGRAVVPQHNRWYIRIQGWLDRFGMLAIFGLSAAPLLFDVAGLVAGVMRFPVIKFFIACFLGRSVLYILLAWAGALGWETVIDWLGA